MSKQVCVFLADGFEEIEGLTVVDLLRRAGIAVTTVSISESYTVHGAHGIDVQADKLFDEVTYDDKDMAVLPGGMPGTLNLGAHSGVKAVLEQFYDKKRWIAAICAAPSVLGKYGMLQGRKATSYPGFEEALNCAEYVCDAVAVDEFIVTSRGMGTAIDFAIEIVRYFMDDDTVEKIKKALVY